MKRICCDYCSRFLIEVPEETSQGAIAARVNTAGFRAKNSFFFTGTSSWYNFCSIECNRFFYLDRLNIPQEKLDEMSAKMAEIRKEIPRMAKEAAEAIGPQITKLVEELERRRKR